MRINSLIHYKYLIQLIREEPLQLKRYSPLLILIPLTAICFLYNWEVELILMVALGYCCAVVGFFTAYSTGNAVSIPFRNRIYQKMIEGNNLNFVLVEDKRTNKIVHVNSTFREVLGFEEEYGTAFYFEDFVETSFLQKMKKRRSSKLSVLPFQKEEVIRLTKQNGEKLWVTVNVKDLDNENVYSIYTFQDVTEKIDMENATRQFALDLVQRKQSLVVNNYPILRVS